MADRVGVLELVSGQLRFRMIDGTMTDAEMQSVQKFLNESQPLTIALIAAAKDLLAGQSLIPLARRAPGTVEALAPADNPLVEYLSGAGKEIL